MVNKSLTLQQAKDLVKAGLRDGVPGVVGVGGDASNNELLVFVDQEKKATQFLQKSLAGGFQKVTLLRPAKEDPLLVIKKIVGKVMGKLLQHKDLSDAPISLVPGSKIQPDGGDQGCVGCFVALGDESIAVLTVEHLFHRQRQNPQVVNKTICDTTLHCLQPIGDSKSFGGFKNVDCALFLPREKVDLGRGVELTGGVVTASAVANTVAATVTNLASSSQGKVLDVDAAVKFPVFLGGSAAQEVLLDGQILIGSPQSPFGVNGNSGSLVIMDGNGNNNSYQKGDALGLYSVIMRNSAYHFVTPMHACMAALGATSIHQP